MASGSDDVLSIGWKIKEALLNLFLLHNGEKTPDGSDENRDVQMPF